MRIDESAQARRFMSTVVVAVVLFTAATAQGQEEYFGAAKERRIAFTSRASSDSLIAQVQGRGCPEAVLAVTIQQPDGRKIYEYSTQFSGITADLDVCHTEGFAQSIVDWIAYQATRERSLSLPEATKVAKDPDCKLLVPAEQYIRLRMANVPMVVHSAPGLRRRFVVYDAQAKQAVAILERRGTP